MRIDRAWQPAQRDPSASARSSSRPVRWGPNHAIGGGISVLDIVLDKRLLQVPAFLYWRTSGAAMARILVTGGSGFIGSALVKALAQGRQCRARARRQFARRAAAAGRRRRRTSSSSRGDIRDAAAVHAAVRGVDEVHHLAFVNGTEFFYSAPELVLDVGVKGMVNVIDACRAAGVRRLMLASSSEVYQTPPQVPTDESAPLIVPDPTNPRYSYGGGKIISELMAINYGRKFFDRVLIFRPHNVYGPDMGFEHVIPQFALRLKRAAAQHKSGKVPFEIHGDGRQTRSFCHVDDLVRGVHGDARQGRASRHLSRRHHRGGHHRRRRPAHRGPRRPRDRVRQPPGARRRHRAALPRHRQARQAGLCARRCRSPRACRRPWTGTGPTKALRRKPDPLHHRVSEGDIRVFPTKVARAAGSGGSVPVEACQVCGHEKLETVLSLGYMPPVNQMVAGRRGAAPTAVVSDHAALLRQLRAGAARPRGRSGHHLPAGISLHQRHDQAAARQLRRALRRVLQDARPRPRTISSSTSAPTTAR